MLTPASLEREAAVSRRSPDGFAHSAAFGASRCAWCAGMFENVVGAPYAEAVLECDPSQHRVLSLDPRQHARVLGAPGSGKTTLIGELWATLTADGWSDEQLLVLAPNRHVASALRRQLERRLDRAIGGTPVRSAASFAFAVLQRHAALSGRDAPRLLTGTAQDEAVEAVITELVSGEFAPQHALPFQPDVLLGSAFRGELRELGRVLDDADLSVSEALAQLSTAPVGDGTVGGQAAGDLTPDLRERWLGAAELLDRARVKTDRERPGELSSSAMLRAARRVLRDDREISVPALVLVDDAGELGEGGLALLAALAERGTTVWVFGDPDIATSAFQGERTRVLGDLVGELRRRGAPELIRGEDQLVVLEHVYRHGPKIRQFVQQLSGRVGAAGAGQQRRATAAISDAVGDVSVATVGTSSEQLGAIAHQLRARHLGLGGSPKLPWSQMAVLCRTRGEVKRVARALAGLQVPSETAAGGLVLREHDLVRDLVRVLQHALDLAPLDAREVMRLLGGPLGGLDPIALRRLRAALRLHSVNEGQTPGGGAAALDALVLEGFEFPGERPIVDMRAARQLRTLGVIAAEAQRVHAAGGTPREVLWQIWQGSGLAPVLQEQALGAKGARADDAHRALDGVLGLFFALQRHEEHDSDQPIDALLTELMTSTVPEDSLAARGAREVVTVTTPQGAIGQQFEFVCVLGPQDGEWPNLRARGSLLGVTALERVLRDGAATLPTRHDTLHDELRLLVHAIARARTEVLVIAVKNEDLHPSVFFALGRDHLISHELPSSRLTLRGAVAEMRRRLVQHPGDEAAREALVQLARAGVPGAHPDDWYGVRPPSTARPLADIDAGETVRVSPSQLQRAETCPLDWFVSSISGFTADYRANVGTLLHRALETAGPDATAESIRDEVFAHWDELRFDAEWQSRRAHGDTEHMASAVARYLADFTASGHTLLAREATFEVPLEFARLRGNADRIEAVRRDDGSVRVTVVDLKTGRTRPSAAEVEDHAQLQAYQLGAEQGAFVDSDGHPIHESAETDAKLVYVHADTLRKPELDSGTPYAEFAQPGLTEQTRDKFISRVLAAAAAMAGASFEAQVEHHCSDPFAIGAACALHIIPAVSHA